MLWNPFRHLRETKHYPTARLLRSSLWRRIKDTFAVFWGSHSNSEQVMGIIDYIFPIPRLCDLLTKKLSKMKHNKVASSFHFLLTLPNIFLLTIKFIAAILLTALVSLLVFLTHIVSQPLVYIFNKQIHQLQITVVMERIEYLRELNDKKISPTKQALIEAFNYKKIQEKLNICVVYKHFDKDVGINYSMTKQSETDQITLVLREGYCLKGIISITPENTVGIKNLFKLNKFNITKYLETMHDESSTKAISKDLEDAIQSAMKAPTLRSN